MSCPYYEEEYFGTCRASESRYVPSIGIMEKYCFKKSYRLCPTLSVYQKAINIRRSNNGDYMDCR
jgi:hypothetical protein